MDRKSELVNMVKEYLDEIFADNDSHIQSVKEHKGEFFPKRQTPRATAIMCSDSRVQVIALDATPINDVFIIRNIGNQVYTAEGSVEYGVCVLKTPMLLIIGHSSCGAIDAAMHDHKDVPKTIKKELDSLMHISKDAESVSHGALKNVHFQVDYALKKFADQVKNREVTVVGMIYDFSNHFHHDSGKLFLVNYNGEKDPDILLTHPELIHLSKVHIGL
ncbi:MAG: carbonic anhydrase [Rickettsiaceae bacterium]|nr:carbonic anhydrase [Rickettsiaceae bacterium]